MQFMERVSQSEDANPTTTNSWKEEKEKNVGDEKDRLGQQESIGYALETCQSHTKKHKVTTIVPKRH